MRFASNTLLQHAPKGSVRVARAVITYCLRISSRNEFLTKNSFLDEIRKQYVITARATRTEPFGACCNNVLLANLIEERVLGQERHGREGSERHGEERQRQVPKIIHYPPIPRQPRRRRAKLNRLRIH